MLPPLILPIGYTPADDASQRQDALLELRRAEDALDITPGSARALERLHRARAALRQLSTAPASRNPSPSACV